MKSGDVGPYVVLGCVVAVILLAVAVGWTLGLAWLVQWTAAGFGHQLPYWPVVGAVVIAQVGLCWVGNALRAGRG